MSIACEVLVGVLHYFYDVDVYGSNPEEHWRNLRVILHTLRTSGLRLDAKKCVVAVSVRIDIPDGVRP